MRDLTSTTIFATYALSIAMLAVCLIAAGLEMESRVKAADLEAQEQIAWK